MRDADAPADGCARTTRHRRRAAASRRARDPARGVPEHALGGVPRLARRRHPDQHALRQHGATASRRRAARHAQPGHVLRGTGGRRRGQPRPGCPGVPLRQGRRRLGVLPVLLAGPRHRGVDAPHRWPLALFRHRLGGERPPLRLHHHRAERRRLGHPRPRDGVRGRRRRCLGCPGRAGRRLDGGGLVAGRDAHARAAVHLHRRVHPPRGGPGVRRHAQAARRPWPRVDRGSAVRKRRGTRPVHVGPGRRVRRAAPAGPPDEPRRDLDRGPPLGRGGVHGIPESGVACLHGQRRRRRATAGVRASRPRPRAVAGTARRHRLRPGLRGGGGRSRLRGEPRRGPRGRVQRRTGDGDVDPVDPERTRGARRERPGRTRTGRVPEFRRPARSGVRVPAAGSGAAPGPRQHPRGPGGPVSAGLLVLDAVLRQRTRGRGGGPERPRLRGLRAHLAVARQRRPARGQRAGHRGVARLDRRASRPGRTTRGRQRRLVRRLHGARLDGALRRPPQGRRRARGHQQLRHVPHQHPGLSARPAQGGVRRRARPGDAGVPGRHLAPQPRGPHHPAHAHLPGTERPPRPRERERADRGGAARTGRARLVRAGAGRGPRLPQEAQPRLSACRHGAVPDALTCSTDGARTAACPPSRSA